MKICIKKFGRMVAFFVVVIALFSFLHPPKNNHQNIKQYAFIKSIKTINGHLIISADYVQMLTGKAAIQAAKKDGMADTVYNDAGTKIVSISVPNDYYIVNTNKKLRTIPLSKKIFFEVENIKASSQAALKNRFIKAFKDKLYTLILQNDLVTVLHEVYLP